MSETSSIPWDLGVYDSHCHPTDTMSQISVVSSMKARTLTIMSTRRSDQHLVASVARSHPKTKIIPSFGYHPWFSHLIYDDDTYTDNSELKQKHYSAVLVPPPDNEFISQLPAPTPLSTILQEMHDHLEEFPYALIGEIGLDRGFRLPFPDTNEEGQGRRLSPHRVSIDHQKHIFTAQLRLAGSLNRAVSVHGVQCHGVLFETFRDLWRGHELPRERRKDQKRRRRRRGAEHEYLPDIYDSGSDSDQDPPEKKQLPFPPRICLHSFSAPMETLKQYLSPPSPTTLCPSQLFFSFSTTINARPEKGHLGRIGDTIVAIPDECVLVESDLHTAGEEADKALGEALLFISNVKGWEVEKGVKQLGENWRRFVFGDEAGEKVEG
ncbi:hypothetical protein BDD12DRAFT_821524 [Trichophaea hybrida]|nr:hypothetical protein BDD12DRAFT_821524 [Trichophaea hybrida]